MLYMPCGVWGWRQHASSALSSWISYNMCRQVAEGDSQGMPTMSRGYLCIWFTAKGELRWPIVNQYLLLRYSWLLWSFIAHKLMWDTIRWSTLIVVNDYLLQFLNKHHTIVEIEWSTSSFSITKWKQMAKKGGVEVLFNEEFFQHVSGKKKVLL